MKGTNARITKLQKINLYYNFDVQFIVAFFPPSHILFFLSI